MMSNPLFILRKPDEILNLYGQKPKTISRYMLEKLSRCDKAESYDLFGMIQRLMGCSISAEVTFINDDGKEFYTGFPKLNGFYLALADDGQGDLWMLRLADGVIVFFDHDKEEMIPLNIDFWQFLQLADLIAQWEQFLNTKPEDASEQEAALWAKMEKIEPELRETYPFSLQ